MIRPGMAKTHIGLTEAVQIVRTSGMLLGHGGKSARWRGLLGDCIGGVKRRSLLKGPSLRVRALARAIMRRVAATILPLGFQLTQWPRLSRVRDG
jgi:hypothetical protein